MMPLFAILLGSSFHYYQTARLSGVNGFSRSRRILMVLLIDVMLVSKSWPLRQVNVNNSFLNGDLDSEVLMQQSSGYVQYGSDGKPFVCRLKKALYGLRQAPRAWFEKLRHFLISVGFVCLKPDASLFIWVRSDSTLYVLVYVDDIIIIGSMSTSIDWFIRLLNDEFSLKDMGDLHYFLGIEVTHSSSRCLHLCQKKYIRDLIDRSSMTNAKSVPTPMLSSSTMSKDNDERLTDPTEYRSLTGGLQGFYDTYMARLILELSFAQKQQVVSRSVAEAEYRSLAAAASDATCAIAVAANPVLHSKFKHVELDLFFVREEVTDGSIVVGEVLACDQVADVLTKPLLVMLFT
ncbi:hypothetical protein CXB51_015041 [Gossypium anomalum]|uniref:Reverse transcriptase Ty1/copia-type domain-containing protein n=1 Tax=Gossypium anomalum TaxID=47600 RepID=A0A8J6D0Y5_9ROSI|nr:hypothetical protein CXB51_015041 [Gossypium anomalum]